MFSTPETSVRVLDKNGEISPLEREEGYGGKGSGEKGSFKMRMEDPVRHTDYRFRSRFRAWRVAMKESTLRWPTDNEVGTRRDGGSLFHILSSRYHSCV